MHSRSAGLLGALLLSAACGDDSGPAATPAAPQPPPASAPPVVACVEDGEAVEYAYYTGSMPMSAAVDGEHVGFEAAILDALEAMEGLGFRFHRHPIAEWPGLWHLPATDEFDMAGGAILIVEHRRFDRNGVEQVAFTNGHQAYRQAVLTRAEDAARFPEIGPFPHGTVIGALRESTTEVEVLHMHGYADENGVLTAGVSVHVPDGVIVADGSDDYRIISGHTSEILADRTLIVPPGDGPHIRVLPVGLNRIEVGQLLRDGSFDVLVRSEVGSLYTVSQVPGLAIAAVGPDTGGRLGFTVDIDEEDFLACLNEAVDYLTDDLRISVSDWLAHPNVLAERATAWSPDR